jgi:hypothetical protein
MPSDEKVVQALKSLSGQTQAFRSSLATTIDQIRSFQLAHGSAAESKIDRLAAELGPFAAGRIDLERYSSLHTDTLKLDRPTLETIDKALQTLSELAARGEELFLVEVESGADLYDTVGAALADVGRAFGAARVFEVSKFGRFPDSEHARSLGSFPFHKWSSGERRLSPPLIVSVDGADLRASGLAEFMDGTEKIVLVVRGESTPVPLVRLITPGTFVLQSTKASDVDRLADWDGAGVAAVVPDSAAQFVHDPGVGALPSERLKILSLPEDRRRKPVGGVSVKQQSEELLQLTSLAGHTAVADMEVASEPAAAAVPSSSDPVDKLAAWLLTQADLKNL